MVDPRFDLLVVGKTKAVYESSALQPATKLSAQESQVSAFRVRVGSRVPNTLWVLVEFLAVALMVKE